MSNSVTLDTFTFLVLLISVLVLGIMVGIVGAPFMPEKPRRQPSHPIPEPEELDPAERHWVKRGPAGGR